MWEHTQGGQVCREERTTGWLTLCFSPFEEGIGKEKRPGVQPLPQPPTRLAPGDSFPILLLLFRGDSSERRKFSPLQRTCHNDNYR